MKTAKTIVISAKCGDMVSGFLKDGDGQHVGDYEGRIPEFVPNLYGDYLKLEVDLATGRILNWTPPTQDQLNELGGI
jgi:hypothetical protein